MKTLSQKTCVALALSYFLGAQGYCAHFYQDSPSASTNGAILHVRLLNVGQGDCTVVRFPTGKILMLDCGSTKGGDPAKVNGTIDLFSDGTVHPVLRTEK